MYFSPERVKYDKFSFPSDIWALGMCLYELLSGEKRFPFPIEIDAIINKQAASLPDYVPAFFSRVVLRMLEKKQEDRITSEEAMKELLTGNIIPMPVPPEPVPSDFVLNLPKTGNKMLD